jgi:putative acetyltransferase
LNIATERAVLIRAEQEKDWVRVRTLNASAFETPAEAELVDALRRQARPIVSLVADEGGEVVGHIMFSPVSLSGYPDRRIMGLAPMPVASERQRRGIGGLLVRGGLEQCRQLGFGAVVVLGHPEYYPRFGFSPAARFGIRCEWDTAAEAFVLMELLPGYLRGVSGTAKYHAAFSGL